MRAVPPGALLRISWATCRPRSIEGPASSCSIAAPHRAQLVGTCQSTWNWLPLIGAGLG
jgi:hypothetical protein